MATPFKMGPFLSARISLVFRLNTACRYMSVFVLISKTLIKLKRKTGQNCVEQNVELWLKENVLFLARESSL